MIGLREHLHGWSDGSTVNAAFAEDWSLVPSTQVGDSRSKDLSSTPGIEQFPPTETGRNTEAHGHKSEKTEP